MLTAIHLLLIRQYKKKHPDISVFRRRKTILYITAGLCFFLAAFASLAQEKRYSYTISMNGKSAGKLNIIQKFSADSVILDINSAVSTRIIFLFRAMSADKTIFKNGKMSYSYSVRQVNNGHKYITITKDLGSTYQSLKEGKIKELKRCIYHNMSSLYLLEPVAIKEVFSDVFQDFLAIARIGPHGYKVKLPDGNYNEYFYDNGICKKVKLYHSLFTAQMDLKTPDNL